jgi:hypothetical protein
MGTASFRSLLVVGVLSTAGSVPLHAADDNAALPIEEVALFRSGVGYFFRRGMVEDDAAIDLSFTADQINDILKSLVVIDRDGGSVTSVDYASMEPLEHRLAGFALDLSDGPPMWDLLQQLQGEPVRVRIADREIVGRVMSVEERIETGATGDLYDLVDVQYVNLITSTGIMSLPIPKLTTLEILNEKLADELNRALAVVVESHNPDKKQVTIRLKGSGSREIVAGYVTEMPIWKMSYRLVMDDADSALLQGWAIIENTTDDDWNDVQLTLVSGRPVSFIMNLYQPLFMQRPEIAPDVVGVATAATYEADDKANYFGGEEMQRGGGPRRGGRAMAMEAAPAAAADAMMGVAVTELADAVARMAVASAGSEGEQFFLQLSNPVTLERRQSAMAPVVGEAVDAERISIFNAGVDPTHPMRGLRFENGTGMPLIPGPVTVFDGTLYAGDARLPRVPEDASQIISYAVDLDTKVRVDTRANTQTTMIRIVRGVLEQYRKTTTRTTYEIRNQAPDERTVIVEHPRSGNQELVQPDEPTETTENYYRFEVELEAAEIDSLEVVQSRLQTQRLALLDRSVHDLSQLVLSGDVGPRVKAALADLIETRQAMARLDERRAEIEQEVRAIHSDQDRVRQNVQRIDRDSDLYRRYMTKLSEQETELERLDQERKDLQAQRDRLQAELESKLSNLNVAD